MTRIRFGDNEEPRCGFIEPVDNSRAKIGRTAGESAPVPFRATQKSLDEGRLVKGWCWVSRKTTRFIDHETRGGLVKDFQRDVHGGEGVGGQGFGFVRPHRPTGLEEKPGLCGCPRHGDESFLDEAR